MGGYVGNIQPNYYQTGFNPVANIVPQMQQSYVPAPALYPPNQQLAWQMPTQNFAQPYQPQHQVATQQPIYNPGMPASSGPHQDSFMRGALITGAINGLLSALWLFTIPELAIGGQRVEMGLKTASLFLNPATNMGLNWLGVKVYRFFAGQPGKQYSVQTNSSLTPAQSQSGVQPKDMLIKGVIAGSITGMIFTVISPLFSVVQKPFVMAAELLIPYAAIKAYRALQHQPTTQNAVNYYEMTNTPVN